MFRPINNLTHIKTYKIFFKKKKGFHMKLKGL